MSIGKLWLHLRGKEEFWTFRLSGALRDTHSFMFNTMSVLDLFTSFLCPFSSHTKITYSKWLLLFHRVRRETDLPVRLLEKFTYSNNEFLFITSTHRSSPSEMYTDGHMCISNQRIHCNDVNSHLAILSDECCTQVV